MFDEFPAGMKSPYVVGHIAGEKPVFSSLDFLFQLSAVVGEGRFLVGLGGWRTQQKQAHGCDDPKVPWLRDHSDWFSNVLQ